MRTVQVTTKGEIMELSGCSAITLEGLVGSDVIKFAQWAVGHGAAKSTNEITAHIISGSVMNRALGLTGTNAYADDTTIVSLTGLNNVALTMARFECGARWMDDVVGNNLRREQCS